MRNVSLLVDEAATARLLVLGSLPPAGRDLDLLAWPDDRLAVSERLRREGFRPYGGSLVRFADCSAYAVDLIAAESWGVSPDAMRRAFDAAIPLEGMRHLVRPAPHHAVLILARLGMTEKRFARLQAALAEDPDALARARAEAPEWHADLRRLEPRRRVRPRRPSRRFVIALSGVDGSGKSSQATATTDALERLGREAEAVWLPITANPSVWKMSAAARRAVRSLRRLPGFRGLDRKVEGGESFLARPGSTQEPGLLTSLWVSYIAVANCLTHRRLARRAPVVVFDRYVLDSVVRMRYLWGSRFRTAAWLLRVLSPKPAVAFLLDVPGEVAHARKPEQWTAAELERFAELYREEAGLLGVTVLDGTRPREELCAEIAEAAWRAVG
jgi:thymidylate kinase